MDHLIRSARNGFVAGGVDRLHDRRGDEAWVRSRLAEAQSCFLPVWRSRNLIARDHETRAGRLSGAQVAGVLEGAESITLLGQVNGVPIFGLGLPGEDETAPEQWSGVGEFRDLRSAAPLLSRRDAGLLAQARAYAHWHRQHRFCGRCGAATRGDLAGHVRVCTREGCGHQVFPRLDPAVIVLVTCGDRCLLGRQPRWPAKRYSTLAGFVEPGESIEEAVVREIAEETGVNVSEITYHSSQPWPFPASLMLGFTAVASCPAIRVDHAELEDARWFSREELAAALERGQVVLPYSMAISYHLIEDWYDGAGARRLADLTTAP
jgi:NAD+ diphosphatase